MPKTKTAAAVPAHVVRPPARRSGARVVPHVPAREYAPGHFLQPVLAWWPGWQPSPVQAPTVLSAAESIKATEGRQRLLAEGRAVFNSRVALPGSSAQRAPAWLGAAPTARSKC